MFHTVLPLVAYAGILVAAFGLPRRPTTILFVVGGITLLLLFVGIHNAWDTVTYIVIERWEEKRARDTEPSGPPEPSVDHVPT